MESAWMSFISSSSAAYTILCRWSEPTPSNAGEAMRNAKCDSPSSPFAPAWPACCADSSTISRMVGASASISLAAMRWPIGPSSAAASAAATI
eukprot:scaffold326059_cov63-Tisochrysis_lutea.AAC.3